MTDKVEQAGNKQKRSLKQILPWILVVGGTIGLLAAAQLTLEKFNLLTNPGEALSCDLSPIVACGSVINTDQASAFGVPNPFLGLAGFAVLITIGMGMFAGAKFKRWFWLGLQAGAVFGIVFVHWLIYQSLYTIGALCPYCMVVWTIMIPLFVYITLYNFDQKHTKTPKKLKRVVNFTTTYRSEIVLVWYVVIIALILNRFWYYWSTLI